MLRFDGVRNVPWQPPAGEHLPQQRKFKACSLRAMGLFGLAPMKGWQVGRTISWPITRSSLDRMLLRSLRIVKELFGLAGGRGPPVRTS